MGLLKGIDPLLTADLLYVLRSMVHGDRLVVCDCHFPATSVAQQTTTRKCIVLTTTSLPAVLDAITSVLPLDYFDPTPVQYMAPSKGLSLPPAGRDVLQEMKAVIEKNEKNDDEGGTTTTTNQPPPMLMTPVERFSFYSQAKTNCYAVVQTLERRPYANVILQKGVVGPDGKDLFPSTAW